MAHTYQFAFGQTKLGSGGIRKTDDRIDLSSTFTYKMGTYLTQTAGVGYQPLPQLKSRLGVGLREVLTRDFHQYSDDPSTEKREDVSVDGGIESVTEAEWQLRENLLLSSKLEIFAPITALDETTLRNNRRATVEISEYVNVHLNGEIVQDDKASEDVQIKQVFALGLSYAFL